MTAAEARALTNARCAETRLDYQMRIKVWPAIEGVAASGDAKTTISLRPYLLQMVGLTPPEGRRVEELVAARLIADGFIVKVIPPNSNDCYPAVEVTW